MDGTARTVVIALAGNLAIAVVKFLGAFFSGSSALLAEGVHSVVDTFNEVFLYLGLRRQRQPASLAYPLGHGRERYVWSFVAAIFIFAAGSLVSLYGGVTKWLHPGPIEHPAWAAATLLFALVAEGTSLVVGLREAQGRAARFRVKLFPFLRGTADTTLLTVVLEDSAAIGGLAIAGLGVAMTQLTGDGRWDAAGSIAIGVLLAALAFVLGRRSHALLLGHAAPASIGDRLDALLAEAPFVARVRQSYTIQFAPDELILAGKLELKEDLRASALAEKLDRLEARLVAEVPTLKRVYLEVEPPAAGVDE